MCRPHHFHHTSSGALQNVPPQITLVRLHWCLFVLVALNSSVSFSQRDSLPFKAFWLPFIFLSLLFSLSPIKMCVPFRSLSNNKSRGDFQSTGAVGMITLLVWIHSLYAPNVNEPRFNGTN